MIDGLIILTRIANVWKNSVECYDFSLSSCAIYTVSSFAFTPWTLYSGQYSPRHEAPSWTLAHAVSSTWNACFLLLHLTNSFSSSNSSTSTLPPQDAVFRGPSLLSLSASTFHILLSFFFKTCLLPSLKGKLFKVGKLWLYVFVFQNLKPWLAPNKHLLNVCY